MLYILFSSESGLVLILVHVTKDSPAWMCGLRDGDAIVTVNEWQITLMERPEVGFFCHSCLYSLPRLLSTCFKPVLTWSDLAFSVIMDSAMAAGAGLLVSSDIWRSAITSLYDLVFES